LNTLTGYNMEQVQVGLFKLPGIRFEKNQVPLDLQEEMSAWCEENNCGTQMTEWLWSFKNDAQRDWFILRWNDALREYVKEDDKS